MHEEPAQSNAERVEGTDAVVDMDEAESDAQAPTEGRSGVIEGEWTEKPPAVPGHPPYPEGPMAPGTTHWHQRSYDDLDWQRGNGDPLPAPPPPTPPPHDGDGEDVWRGTRGLREFPSQAVEAARRAWAFGPGRLAPVAWRTAEGVRRYPWWSGALTGLVVLLTDVTLSHIALAVVILAGLGLGPSSGSTTRRERVVSLVEVGRYRKHRRRIRRRWVRMWANAGLVRQPTTPGAGKRHPAYRGARPHRDGVTVRVAGEPVAVGVDQVLSASAALAETAGALSVRVTKPKGQRAAVLRHSDLLHVTFKFRDPFPARPITVAELPPPSRPGHVVIGLDEEHRGLEKSLFLPSLIVGAPGSGKSTEVWTTLRALRVAGIPFRLRVFDPKGGLELGDLREAAFRYESLPSRWPQFLQAACEGLRVRQEIMRKMSTDRGVQVRKIVEPTEDFPLDLMLIDELVTALAMSRGQEARVRIWGQEMSAREAFVVYLSQVRASLGSVIALSQLGEKNILGPSRGLFSYVSVLRVGRTEKELVDILLGNGAHSAYPAHNLDPSDPNMAGRGWVQAKEGVIGYRAAFMNDRERAVEAREIEKATARYRARGQRDPEVQETVRQSSRGRRGRGAKTGSGSSGGAK